MNWRQARRFLGVLPEVFGGHEDVQKSLASLAGFEQESEEVVPLQSLWADAALHQNLKIQRESGAAGAWLAFLGSDLVYGQMQPSKCHTCPIFIFGAWATSLCTIHVLIVGRNRGRHILQAWIESPFVGDWGDGHR